MNFETLDPHSSPKAHIASQRFAGIMMIVTGGIFLLSMSGVRIFGFSPWVLMAVLPVFWSISLAVKHLREDGRITLRVVIPLLFVIVPFGFVALSMMGLNLGQYWPVMAIALGIWFVIRR